MTTHTHTDALPITDTISPDDELFERRRRRLRLALHDLGLRDLVPADWASFDADGVTFAPLDQRTAELLVRQLEHVANSLEQNFCPIQDERPEPGPGERRLPGLTALPALAGHLRVVA